MTPAAIGLPRREGVRRAGRAAALFVPLAITTACYEIDVVVEGDGSGTAHLALDVPRGDARQPFDPSGLVDLFEGPGVSVTSVDHLDVLDRRRILLTIAFHHLDRLPGARAFQGLSLTLASRKDELRLEATYREPNPEGLRSEALRGRPVRIGLRLPGVVRESNGTFSPTGPSILWQTSTDALAAGPLSLQATSGMEFQPPGVAGGALAALAAAILIAGFALGHAARERRPAHAFLLAGGAATLAFEVILTRLFSAVLWYHFAFMAISIALLGQGAGASLVTALGPRGSGRREAARGGGRALSLTGACIVAALAYITRETAMAGGSTLGFVVLFLAAALPFLFFGAGVARLFEEEEAGAGSLYFANLLGAAVGTLAAIPLISFLGADTALLAVGLFALAAGAGLSRGIGKGLALAGAVAAAALLAANRPDGPLILRTGKSGVAKEIYLGVWNSFSYVTVGPEFGAAWALPAGYSGPRTRSLGLEIDLNAFTPIIKWNGDPQTVQEPLHDVTAVVHRLKPGGHVLVIGPGGGKDVLAALVCGAERITAVEINPSMVALVRDRFSLFSGGIYSHPAVEMLVENGRTFVDRPGPSFHVIQASLVDTWAASASGAFTLTENHLYTLEAFQAYLGRLEPGGLLSVSRWRLDPPRESLRLLELATAALHSRGAARPLDHVAVLAAGDVATFLVARDPLDAEMRSRIDAEARRSGFELLWGGAPAAKPDDLLHQALSGALDPKSPSLPWDLSAPTDDRPFYFHCVRARDYLRIPWKTVWKELPKIEEINAEAVWVVVRLFWISLLASAALVLGPLLLARRRLGRLPFGWPLLYFSCLGIAFVFVVSGNIGRLSVRFGNPTLAFVTLTFTTLLGASAGAALSPLLAGKPKVLLLAVPLGVAVFVFTLGSSELRSVPALGLLMALQGLLLGLPFPRGIEAVRGTSIVPWAFAANGAMSVVAGGLALVIALLFGYRVLLLAGVFLYFVAALAYPLLHRDA